MKHRYANWKPRRRAGQSFPLAQLLAPISGTVAQRLVGPGQFVQAGSSTPVFSIGNFGRLWLIGNVREEDATQMRSGEAVDVAVAAVPGRNFPAKLTWVAPSIDAATHRLAVRAEIDNPDGKLKPAMFATMLVHTGSDRISAAIPEIAVIHEGDRSPCLGIIGRSQSGPSFHQNGTTAGRICRSSGWACRRRKGRTQRQSLSRQHVSRGLRHEGGIFCPAAAGAEF